MKRLHINVLVAASVVMIAAALWTRAPQRAPASKLSASPQSTLAAGSPVAAASPSPAAQVARPLANVDRRSEAPGHEARQAELEKSRAVRRAALEELQAKIPGVRVDFDET